MDIVDNQTRSRMMSGIKSKNTKPELIIRKALYQKGYRYRLHVKDLPGKPDIVLRKFNAVIFIHGCFWHKHDCHLFKWPKTRPEFWVKKITSNARNDEKVLIKLTESGWRIGIVWECSLKGKNRLDFDSIVDKISYWLLTNEQLLEISG